MPKMSSEHCNKRSILRIFFVVLFIASSTVFLYLPLTSKAIPKTLKPYIYSRHFIEENRNQQKIVSPLPEQINSTKYLIYVCMGSGCGGLGDRGRGVVTTFLLSLISNRTFGIQHKNPDVNIFFKENKIQWRLKGHSFKGLKVRHVGFMDQRPSLKLMHKFEKFTEDVIYLNTNTEFVVFLKEQTKYYKFAPWLKTTSKEDIYRTVFYALFKPTDYLMRHLKHFYLKINGSKLKCAHLRFGRNPNNPHDPVQSRFVKWNDLPMIVEFLKSGMNKNYKVFVSSDSAEIQANVSKQFPFNSLDVPGEISHVDRTHIKNKTSVFLKGVLTQIIFAYCNVLLISHSGFSIMSAYLRNDSNNLFCMKQDHTSIVPCNRSIY